jgi:uncharacterized protein DUF2779
MASPSHLTKSHILSGLQCHKRLWWERHEPEAQELAKGPVLIARLEESRKLGILARDHAPGGQLIGVPHWAVAERVAATRQALAGNPDRLYEAAFEADGVFAAVDILERLEGGTWGVVEVKSSASVKEEHLPDVAVQLHVVRSAGLAASRAEVMHVNRECRYPDLSTLFVRKDVTPVAEAVGLGIPDTAVDLRKMLAGPLPDVPIGAHCNEPRECPFKSRCWSGLPEHHIGTLHRIGVKAWSLKAQGYERVTDLPRDMKLSDTQRRQRRALENGSMVVEPELGEALREFASPLAFLDFETVGPAVPAWPDCRPYDAIPVQLSCHRETPAGLKHYEWIADGPEDPRPEIAAKVLEACAGARAIVTYHRSFESGCLERLAEALPLLSAPLRDLKRRLVDLEVLVTEHVYHPAFLGSFSIKRVLPALVSGVSYDGLEVDDGMVASVKLARLVFERDALSAAERNREREAVRAYCERDTWAMVKLLERLRELVTPAPSATQGTAQLNLGL